MKRLYKRRLSNHLIQMARYLKYVFNDFFVIALLFFVGGLGLAYSNFLKTLHSGNVWIAVIIGIVILLALQLGRLATLTQDPDYVFLLPKDRDMKGYLLQALKYSGVNAAIIQIVVWFILLPMLKIQFKLGWAGLICWLVIMLGLKMIWLMGDLNLEFQDHSSIDQPWLDHWLIPLVMIVLGLFDLPWISLILTVLWLAILSRSYSQQSSPLNWLRIIRTEDHRMHDIYTIFNMFVDVPNFGSAISHRRYLAPVFKLVAPSRLNTYLYLYWHGFLRDKEFSNLYARLVIIGLIILVFINGTIFSAIMGLVFVYLIVFQIIPFYFHFESNAFIHIYPLSGIDQLKSFQKMLWWLMGLVEVLFTIGSFVNNHSLIATLILFVIMMIENYAMIKIYLPKQAKKNN